MKQREQYRGLTIEEEETYSNAKLCTIIGAGLFMVGLIIMLILGFMTLIYSFSHPELTRTQIIIYNLNNNFGKIFIALVLSYGGKSMFSHFSDVAAKCEYKISKYYQSIRNREIK